MERNPVVRQMKARALTDPRPSFVSLVGRGANQEPFRAVKADIPDGINQESDDMDKALEAARKSGMDIAMLTFRGEDFDTEDKVKKWLDDGGYSGYDLQKKTEKVKDKDVAFFEAASKSEFTTGSVRKIKGVVPGLTVFVGKVEGAPAVVEKTDEEKAAEKAAERTSAVASADGAVLKTDDPAPAPAAPEVKPEVKPEDPPAPAPAAKTEPVQPVAAPAAKADEPTLVQKVDGMIAELRTKSMYDVSNLGSILSTLRWMVEDAEYSDLPDTAVASIKSGAQSLLSALVDAMNGAVGTYVDAFKADKPAAKTDPAPAPAPAAPASAPAVKSDAVMPEPLSEMAAAIKAMVEGQTALTAAVKANSEAIAEVKATVKSDAEATDARMKALEGAGQSRKSGDAEDAVTPKADPAKKSGEQALAERRFRSALGSYKAASGFGQ